jgi:hypothetical protein
MVGKLGQFKDCILVQGLQSHALGTRIYASRNVEVMQ